MAALLLRGTFHLWLGEIKNSLADLEAVIENDMADKKVIKLQYMNKIDF